MDSIPWEKAQLEAEEKPHYVLNKKNMRTIERTSRCALDGKDEKDYSHADDGKSALRAEILQIHTNYTNLFFK